MHTGDPETWAGPQGLPKFRESPGTPAIFAIVRESYLPDT